MMVNKTVGQTTGHTDTAELSDAIVITKDVSTKVLDAEIVPEGSQPMRLSVAISVIGKDCYVKLQGAGVDNDIKGVFTPQGTTFSMNADGMYSGEISVISAFNGAVVFVTTL